MLCISGKIFNPPIHYTGITQMSGEGPAAFVATVLASTWTDSPSITECSMPFDSCIQPERKCEGAKCPNASASKALNFMQSKATHPSWEWSTLPGRTVFVQPDQSGHSILPVIRGSNHLHWWKLCPTSAKTTSATEPNLTMNEVGSTINGIHHPSGRISQLLWGGKGRHSPCLAEKKKKFMAINTSKKTKHQTGLQDKYGVKSHAMVCCVAGKPPEFRSNQRFLVSRLSVTDGSVTPPCWQFLQPPRETRVHTSCRELTQVLSHTSSANLPMEITTPLKFNNIAPEQWWLEDSPFLSWKVHFSGVTFN